MDIKNENNDEVNSSDDENKKREENINKKLDIILECFKDKTLTPKEIMYIVFKILDFEFNTPRTNLENEERIKSMITVLDSILEQYFSDIGAVSFIGALGEKTVKRHPSLALSLYDSSRAYTS